MPPMPLVTTGVRVRNASRIVTGAFSYHSEGTTSTSISA